MNKDLHDEATLSTAEGLRKLADAMERREVLVEGRTLSADNNGRVKLVLYIHDVQQLRQKSYGWSSIPE